MIFKKIYFMLALTGGLIVSSCDSFLDIQPVGKVIPNSLSEHRALITSVYARQLVDKGLTEIRTDIAIVRREEANAVNYLGDIEIWNDGDPTARTREFDWATYYSNIYYSNAIIDGKDKITEGSQQEINQLVGEAYLMKAYMNFLLVNLYGQPYTKAGAPDSKAIPLKQDLDLEAISGKNTVGEIYASILSDIASARELVNVEQWESKYAYRFSTRSVDALEARVYLYMGDWQKSYEASERVLAGKADLENLNAENPVLPNNYLSVERIMSYELTLSNNDANAVLVNPDFYKKYTEGKDMRRSLFFKTKDENIYSAKVGNSALKCTFRIGEFYLTSAETAARLNKLPEARARLLKLMENRYTSAAYQEKKVAVDAMNQEALVNEILNERALELAFEGHRWFDLRRTTRPEIRKEIKGATHILQADDPRYTLQIPALAKENNPKLIEN